MTVNILKYFQCYTFGQKRKTQFGNAHAISFVLHTWCLHMNDKHKLKESLTFLVWKRWWWLKQWPSRVLLEDRLGVLKIQQTTASFTAVVDPHLLLLCVCTRVNSSPLSSGSLVGSRPAPLAHIVPSLLWADQTDKRRKEEEEVQNVLDFFFLILLLTLRHKHFKYS